MKTRNTITKHIAITITMAALAAACLLGGAGSYGRNHRALIQQDLGIYALLRPNV